MGRMERLNPQATLASAPARVRDAVGRVLEVGDEILMVTPSQIMRVASITPIMDPGAPAGMMLVVLVTKASLGVPRDSSINDLYFLRHQSEIGDKAIEGAGESPSEPHEDMHKDGM